MPPNKTELEDNTLWRQEVMKRLDNQDQMLRDQNQVLKTINEGINGTIESIGLAGRVREVEKWKLALEQDRPLLLQLKELQEWQIAAGKVLLFVFTPIFGMSILGIITLLWGLLTNRIEILSH